VGGGGGGGGGGAGGGHPPPQPSRRRTTPLAPLPGTPLTNVLVPPTPPLAAARVCHGVAAMLPRSMLDAFPDTVAPGTEARRVLHGAVARSTPLRVVTPTNRARRRRGLPGPHPLRGKRPSYKSVSHGGQENTTASRARSGWNTWHATIWHSGASGNTAICSSSPWNKHLPPHARENFTPPFFPTR